MLLPLRRTKVEFSPGFIIVVTLMLLFFDEKIVLLSVLSSLLHEGGNLFEIRLSGEKIEKVVFGAFGLRIERCAFTKISYKSEVLISLGGIAVNYIIFLLSLVIYLVFRSDIAAIFGIINLFVGLFNSVPVKSLDMGKALQNLLKSKRSEENAERIANAVSFIFSLCFLVMTVFYCVIFGLNFSLIAVSLYLLSETELKIYGK